MPIWVARIACLIVVFVGGVAASRAADLTEFNAAIEAVSAHNRVAIGYLRTENFDLASLEIDRMRNAWVRFTERFAGNRPDAFDGNPHYSSLFTGVNARLVDVDLMLKTGRLDAARSGLNAVRKDFYELRKASGVVVLADCVRDANAAMDELMVYNDRTLDWNKRGTDSGVAGKASAYAIVLERCDNIAGEPIRTSPGFRRLVDGAKASLALIPKAIAARDGDLLHRVLIELRSFDNLLDFRFG
ncbi:MAG TPA: hypothetical protein VKP52_00950 [Pseudolabrys sp.]|nr:hypothetical protein [Pseudolabrys sp.]